MLETIVMIYSTQKVSSSIHSVGNKHKERNLYTVMSDNALNEMDVCLTFNLTHSLTTTHRTLCYKTNSLLFSCFLYTFTAV